MKNARLIPALLICFSGLVFQSACTNGDPVLPAQDIIENNMQSGSWRITSFIDSGQDETHHFTGFSFSFEDNGLMTATKGSVTYSGAWNITDGNSNDDSPTDLDFNIVFNLGNDFDELSEDWHFISHSSTRIELIHISGGNGGTDLLTFERL